MTSPNMNINPEYLIHVKDHMPTPLPRPRKKDEIIDSDGEKIPIISVTIGAFE